MPNPNNTTTIANLPAFTLPLTGSEFVPVDNGTTTGSVPVSALTTLVPPAVAILTNLVGWYKGDAGAFQDISRTTPCTSNGQTFGSWADQSGAGNHLAAPTTGQRGTYDTVNGLNSIPALALDGITQTLGTLLSSSFSEPVTVYVVARLDQNQTNGTLLDLSSNASACLRGSATNYQAGSAFAGVQISAGNWGTTSYHLLYVTLNGALSSSRLDNQQLVTDSPAGSATISRVVLGQRGDQANANPQQCHVCELMVYNVSHTAAQIAQNEAYFRLRYALLAPQPVDSNGVANAKTFGAIGDGNSHPLSSFYASLGAAQAVYPHAFDLTNELDWAALQLALNTQAASGGNPVYLPAGTYVVNFPVIVCGKGMRGDGSASLIQASAPGGMPTLILSSSLYPLSAWEAVPTGAALATGAGLSYSLASAHWINLRDFTSGDINGLAHFCVEFFFKPSAIASGHNTLVQSYGQLIPSVIGNCFSVGVSNSGHTTATLNVAGTPVNLTGGTVLSAGTTYHLALTYDGSTVRIFVAGNVDASGSASGSITQQYYEDLTIGDQVNRWPDGSTAETVAEGNIDGFRLSNTARYTANFTPPTAKPSSDANTLLLCNFDLIQGPILGVTTSLGQGYTFQRGTVGLFQPVDLRNLAVSSSRGHSIFAAASTSSLLLNVSTAQGAGGRTGVQFWNNCFTTSIINLNVGDASRYGLAMTGACSEMTVVAPNIKCTGALGLGGSDWGGTVVGGTVFGCPKVSVLAKGDNVSVALVGGPDTGDEGSSTVPDHGILLSGVQACCISGGGGAFLANAISPITIDGLSGNVGAIAINGFFFWLNASTTQAVHVVNSPRKCSIVACGQSVSPLVAWADNPVNFNTSLT